MIRRRFRKMSASTYEYLGTGYVVEQMADGTWDAYLPSAWGYRLWSSPKHATRERAAAAIAMQVRNVSADVRAAIANAKGGAS